MYCQGLRFISFILVATALPHSGVLTVVNVLGDGVEINWEFRLNIRKDRINYYSTVFISIVRCRIYVVCSTTNGGLIHFRKIVFCVCWIHNSFFFLTSISRVTPCSFSRGTSWRNGRQLMTQSLLMQLTHPPSIWFMECSVVLFTMSLLSCFYFKTNVLTFCYYCIKKCYCSLLKNG